MGELCRKHPERFPAFDSAFCLTDVDVSVVFFFQAEDGIRADLVTGVQTCALPISRARHAPPPRVPRRRRHRPLPVRPRRPRHPTGRSLTAAERPCAGRELVRRRSGTLGPLAPLTHAQGEAVAGMTDLQQMLATLEPRLRDGEYVYVTDPGGSE